MPTLNYHFPADYTLAGAGAGVPFWSGSENTCTLPGCTSAAVTRPGGLVETGVTIDYTYDPLYRLTIEVHKPDGFDQSWLQNSLYDPLDEADVDVQEE